MLLLDLPEPPYCALQVDGAWRAKVADFNLSRLLTQNVQEGDSALVLTGSQAAVGSLRAATAGGATLTSIVSTVGGCGLQNPLWLVSWHAAAPAWPVHELIAPACGMHRLAACRRSPKLRPGCLRCIRPSPCPQAPEVLAGHGVSTASDCFSFGTVMWEVLTWRLPWAGVSPFAVRCCQAPEAWLGARSCRAVVH